MKKESKKTPLRVLITAGPTRAYLDSVRYLTNYSTGELGFHLAQELIKRGVNVSAVVGPTHFPFSKLRLKHLAEVETVEEMTKETLRLCRTAKPTIAVLSAAVLDFQPVKYHPGKVSSQLESWKLELVPTPKIIDEIRVRYPSIKRIGFKLEPNPLPSKELVEFAKQLLEKKGLQAVCINFLSQIRKEKHPLWIFTKEGGLKRKCNTKLQIAKALADIINSPELQSP